MTFFLLLHFEYGILLSNQQLNCVNVTILHLYTIQIHMFWSSFTSTFEIQL